MCHVGLNVIRCNCAVHSLDELDMGCELKYMHMTWT